MNKFCLHTNTHTSIEKTYQVAFCYKAHDQSQSSVNKRNVKRIWESGSALREVFD